MTNGLRVNRVNRVSRVQARTMVNLLSFDGLIDTYKLYGNMENHEEFDILFEELNRELNYRRTLAGN